MHVKTMCSGSDAATSVDGMAMGCDGYGIGWDADGSRCLGEEERKGKGRRRKEARKPGKSSGKKQKEEEEALIKVVPQACKESHITLGIRGYLEPYIGEPFESRAATIGLGIVVLGVTAYFIHAARSSRPI